MQMTLEKTKVARSMIMSSQKHDDVKMGHSVGKIEGYGNHSLASEAISISVIFEMVVISQIRLAFIKNKKSKRIVNKHIHNLG